MAEDLAARLNARGCTSLNQAHFVVPDNTSSSEAHDLRRPFGGPQVFAPTGDDAASAVTRADVAALGTVHPPESHPSTEIMPASQPPTFHENIALNRAGPSPFPASALPNVVPSSQPIPVPVPTTPMPPPARVPAVHVPTPASTLPMAAPTPASALPVPTPAAPVPAPEPAPVPEPVPVPEPAPVPEPVPSTKEKEGGGEASGGSPRRSFLGGISSVMGSALSFLPGSRSTQLDDFSSFVYNDKYGAWMPGDVDPDEWAKENLAAPPPPPKKSTQADVQSDSTKPLEGPGLSSAPQTPLAAQADGLPAAGPGGRFSARSAASRKPARSRYVDTFNPDDGAGPNDSDLMPPPPARTKAPAPAYKI